MCGYSISLLIIGENDGLIKLLAEAKRPKQSPLYLSPDQGVFVFN